MLRNEIDPYSYLMSAIMSKFMLFQASRLPRHPHTVASLPAWISMGLPNTSIYRLVSRLHRRLASAATMERTRHRLPL